MNAPEHRLNIPAIGSKLAGGTVLGYHFVRGNPYSIIVPTRAVREIPAIVWHPKNERIAGALSAVDGLTNTREMAAAGSPLGQYAIEQRIEGFEDWFIGAKVDQLIIHSNLALAGAAYQKGGDEAFDEDDAYWTSTQHAWYDAYAWVQYFDNGDQYFDHKSIEYRAFILRRELIR